MNIFEQIDLTAKSLSKLWREEDAAAAEDQRLASLEVSFAARASEIRASGDFENADAVRDAAESDMRARMVPAKRAQVLSHLKKLNSESAPLQKVLSGQLRDGAEALSADLLSRIDSSEKSRFPNREERERVASAIFAAMDLAGAIAQFKFENQDYTSVQPGVFEDEGAIRFTPIRPVEGVTERLARLRARVEAFGKK